MVTPKLWARIPGAMMAHWYSPSWDLQTKKGPGFKLSGVLDKQMKSLIQHVIYLIFAIVK
jgi:hypothetical protein